eukprot:jgi/Picsp_1/2805/NSC_01031-R1_equilibrative nucleoside transporter
MMIRTEQVLYFILGVGILMPWNAFITAADYYQSVFPGKHVDRLITVCYLPLNLMVLALLIPLHNSGHSVKRVLFGFIVFALSMLIVPLMDMSAHPSLMTMLILVAICGAADGSAQGALFGQAACSSRQSNTQALVTGTSTSGVLVCLIRIGTKALFPGTDGIRLSSSLYFFISSILCVACVIIQWKILPRYRTQSSREYDFQSQELLPPSALETQARVVPASDLQDRDSSGALKAENQQSDYLRVGLIIKYPMISLIGCYIVTLSIFPGVITEDLSTQHTSSWYPILLVSVFNVADLIGKCVPEYLQQFFYSGRLLLIISASRLLFIPLYLFAGRLLVALYAV